MYATPLAAEGARSGRAVEMATARCGACSNAGCASSKPLRGTARRIVRAQVATLERIIGPRAGPRVVRARRRPRIERACRRPPIEQSCRRPESCERGIGLESSGHDAGLDSCERAIGRESCQRAVGVDRLVETVVARIAMHVANACSVSHRRAESRGTSACRTSSRHASLRRASTLFAS